MEGWGRGGGVGRDFKEKGRGRVSTGWRGVGQWVAVSVLGTGRRRRARM